MNDRFGCFSNSNKQDTLCAEIIREKAGGERPVLGKVNPTSEASVRGGGRPKCGQNHALDAM